MNPRCVHVTDIGLGYAATMGRLTHLSLRWCPQIRDFGIQTLCSMKSLRSLSLSGKSTSICFRNGFKKECTSTTYDHHFVREKNIPVHFDLSTYLAHGI